MIVLDTSLVGPFAIPDERDVTDIERLLAVFDGGVVVPSHWRLEVANMLRTAVRRGRLSPEGRDEVLERLMALPITVDAETWDRAWETTLALSDRHGLTPYDAAYLEPALRRDVGLATFDRALAQAARGEGVSIETLT